MPEEASAAAGELGWLFESPKSAAIVGAHYLEAVPEDRDDARLREQLDLPAAGSAPASQDGASALLHSLLARHLDDFREGRVVRLVGWTLSRTEVQLCALVSLSTD